MFLFYYYSRALSPALQRVKSFLLFSLILVVAAVIASLLIRDNLLAKYHTAQVDQWTSLDRVQVCLLNMTYAMFMIDAHKTTFM